jgi:O-succinylbenzoic acid--CoA ligase
MVTASAVASAVRLGVTPDDRWYDPLGVHHTGGLVPLVRATLYGTAVVLRDGFDAATALADLAAHGATGVSLVPTMLRRVLDAADGPDGPAEFPPAVRTVLLGGAPARRELIEACRERSVPVHPTYGMTETASQIATAEPADAFDFAGTVGRPLMWTGVTVVDDDGSVLPPGETGELVVSGPTVTPGYYDDPETTEAAFCEHGLRTGDVGTHDESGRLWVLNRKDDTIITGGENVQPGEVAGVLRDHRDVREVAVVGVPDEEWGERVGALIVPRSEQLSVADVEAHCAESLAGFKRPRLLVFAEALPRTPSGTVKREEVRQILLDSERVEVADAEETAGVTDPEETTGVPTTDGAVDAETTPDRADLPTTADTDESVATADQRDSEGAGDPPDSGSSTASGDSAESLPSTDAGDTHEGDAGDEAFTFGTEREDAEGETTAGEDSPPEDVEAVIADADDAAADREDAAPGDSETVAEEAEDEPDESETE